MNNFCKFRLNKIIKIVFSFLLTIGCIAHVYQMCELYYSYPTIVSSETQFENIDNVFPAITICVNNKISNKILTTNETFYQIKNQILITNASIYSDLKNSEDITSDILNTMIISVNNYFNCLTINSLMKGILYFIYTLHKINLYIYIIFFEKYSK